MMSSDGSEVSIWISKSVAFGKILFKSPKIGDMASPGSEEMADIDQMASKTTNGIVPFPVVIFMANIFAGYFATVVPKRSSTKINKRADSKGRLACLY